MRIIKCHITNFGCYSDKIFDFSTKLNSFFLKNGEGKTTLATFIKAMFYSLEKNSKTSYERKHYKPYSGGEYGGSLEIELNGIKYRIERTFADSPTKDTLKIFDSNGIQQSIFLNNKLSQLQGESSSRLGELIFEIDASAFQRCNFISSNDLDFSNNESIKMKIGNIVIDKTKENSFQETYASIMELDLRDKKPTLSKNENAYPYKVEELEKANRDKKAEIQELNQLESQLEKLYLERSEVKQKINEIVDKQKVFDEIHTSKGKMEVVAKYDDEILQKKQFIEDVLNKYKGKTPSKDVLDYLNDNIVKHAECITLDNSYKISPANIKKLEELDGKVVTEDDYSIMSEANSKIMALQNDIGIAQINQDIYEQLKSKFDEKVVRDEFILDNEYIEYKSTVKQFESFNSNYQVENKVYPSEILLSQIDVEIKEYNNLQKKLSDEKLTYKEQSLILKILLIIITFGIYLIIIKKNKETYLSVINKIEEELSQKTNKLNDFFEKYGIFIGSYENRISSLRDEIYKFEQLNKEYTQKKEKCNETLNEKKKDLMNYFSSFGYTNSDIDEDYNFYKRDLRNYHNYNKDNERNNQIKKETQDNKEKYLSLIDGILAKYSIKRREDFFEQLNEIKDNLEFFKQWNPIYINKKENLNEMSKYEHNIKKNLKDYNVDCDFINIITIAKNFINEISKYNEARENKIELIEKKDKFINENNLTGFVAENIEIEEDQLRDELKLRTAELDKKEDEIYQYETNISRKDSLSDEINNNINLIRIYKQKIRIAELAAKALKDAQDEMETKFIDPVKDSFTNYAKQIHEKIASNIIMNYDYDIKYDVKGQLREAKDLSDGERTIMMLALRFAVLDSLYKKHDSIIILDDPFESLDEDKLLKAKKLIKELSNEWQIFYFTCHNSRVIQ